MSRPRPGSALDAYLREVEAEQAVKPNSGLDRRASGRRDHHEGPGEHVAYSGGRAPAAPEHHRQRILRALGSGSDQQEPERMSTNSLGEDHGRELDDIDGCPYAKRKAYKRRSDGRTIILRMPCRVRACPWCGGRRRAARLARDISHAIGNEQVWALVGPVAEVAKWQRRKALRGHLVGHVPLPDAHRLLVINTPYSGAEPVGDVLSLLVSAFEAQPNDSRRYWLAPTYRQVVADLRDERKAKFQELYGECLGDVGASMDEVEAAARMLEVFAARLPDAVVLKPMPDPQVERRFYAHIRLQRGWHRGQEAA